MLRLFTDTDTDMTPKMAEEYGYQLISMPYSVGSDIVYPYEDFDTFDSRAFYDMLRAGTIPTTSALSPEKYTGYFEPVFENGDDILYVHFSAAMTATFGFMEKALAGLKAKYPERKFYSIDTKGITIGSLNIVEEIGLLYKAGASAEQMLRWAETEVDKYAVYFFADDLKFFQKSGRVKGLAATMGTLMGVRPIIFMDANGVMQSIGKERGRLKAVSRLVDYVEKLGDRASEHRIIIGHSDAPEAAEQLAGMLRDKLGHGIDIEFSVVNPTTGSHCGPSTVGVSFHALHR